MNRTFYRSEGLVQEKDGASNASKADAKGNLITIAKLLDEADALLSASRSYVSASKTLLENMKKYVCVVEADIHSSAEGITEAGTRLQRMRSELQSLFQSVFYQDSDHDSRHEESERNVHSIQVTNSVSKHVLDTIREYATDMSIDVNDYTVTWDEYGGVTFVILHPKTKPNDSFNQERNSVDNLTTNQKNISENCLGSSSSMSNTANRKLINIESSGNVYGISEGVECRNRQDAANMQTTDALTETIPKIIDDFKPTDTARKMHQRDDEDPLPVNEHRRRSLQEVNRKIMPYFPVSENDASSSNHPVQGKNSSIANLTEKPNISYNDFRPAYSCFQKSSVTDEHKGRNFTQTDSKFDGANTLTRFTEFASSEKAYLNKRSNRQPNRLRRERRPASKHNSSYQMKNSEEEKASGNTNLFVTPMPQTEDSMRTSHNFHDSTQNKDNETKSVFNQPGADEEQNQEIPPNRVFNKQVGVCSLSPVDIERARALGTTNHLSSKPEEQSPDPAETSSGCLSEGNCIAAALDELIAKLNRIAGHPINMSENWKISSKTSKDLSGNESVSCFARPISSPTDVTTPFIWQKRPLMSFTNPRKPMSKSSRAGTKKAMLSRKREVSPIDEAVSCLLDKKVENSLCDNGNNFDNIVKGKRFVINATLESTKRLNDIINNAFKNSTFEMASDGISKTTVTSDTNMEYDPVTSGSVSSGFYRNGLTATRNHLRSFISQEKKYSSYEKEIPRKLPFISQRKVSEIKKSESRNSFGNKASKYSSSTHGIADFRKHRQEQLKLTKEESIRAAFSDDSSINSSSYLTCKDLSGLEEARVLEKFSDFCLVSDSVTFDNITESEYFNAPNEFDEYACRSKYENATDINYASASAENTKSDIFHDVSSSCSDSATAVNHSRSSLTLRGPECQLPDPIFTLNISRNEKLPREDSLDFNLSLPSRVPENIFKEIRRSSKSICSDFLRSNPDSRTSFRQPFTIKCSSNPVSDSSSSQGDSP